MALKRSAEEIDSTSSRPRRTNSKRAKLSPTVNEASNSSEPSSCSVSEDSALQSSPEQTRQSSMSSLQSTVQDNDDSESSVSSSSEETDSETGLDESSDDIVTIGGPKKPDMSTVNLTDGMMGLKARLATFLPELAESNALLQSGQTGFNMEDVEESGQHIEMDLGLGVLEEQGEDDKDSSSDESSDNSDEREDEAVSSSQVQRMHGGRETDVMEKLQGRPKGRQRPGIEELG